MGTIHIKEFTGGLDTRRLRETTPGGVLIKAIDGHVTRGGEFEKRAAFVPVYDLPDGLTQGLALDKDYLVVFGTADSVTVPSGVRYQKVVHPDGADIVRLLSFDTFSGKTYAVLEFDDGSIHHFYDGVIVANWFDGRGRASFTVVSGADYPAVTAVGSFTITGGTLFVDNKITNVTVGGTSLLAAPVAHTGANDTTATAVAAAIAAASGSTGYTASSSGSQVMISATTAGAAPNGRTVVPVVAGDVTVGGVTNMAGGADATSSKVTDIQVNGVSVIAAPVEWQGSLEATAALIAETIADDTSVPDYTATSDGATVNIVAEDPGAAANGRIVNISVADGMVVTPTTTAIAKGADSSTGYRPGTFVKTIRSKMYAVADGLLHYSGVANPIGWTTDSTGAGFDDLSTENAGADRLVSLARYQSMLAVFAPSVVVIWYIDPDPANNTISQILDNTGTGYPLSVTQFGDADVFYLDVSGLRSLRARDSSNAAATTDLGVPVDDAIVAKLATMSAAEKARITGLINPQDKRFWLIMNDEVFVFSFYQNAKVSAWTTYSLSTRSGAAHTTFEADNAVVFKGQVFVRSGDTIYAYGGEDGTTYDDTQAEAWLPLLDANMPTATKPWTGVDAAVRGTWQISAAMEPTDEAASDVVANVYATTYNIARVPLHNISTHIGLRFKSSGPGPAVLSAAVIHYASNEGEDE